MSSLVSFCLLDISLDICGKREHQLPPSVWSVGHFLIMIDVEKNPAHCGCAVPGQVVLTLVRKVAEPSQAVQTNKQCSSMVFVSVPASRFLP